MEIVAIQNEEIYPPKEKYHVCVSQNGFFLINSQARKIYRPHLKISQTDYRFLRQDSYICCSRIFEYATISNYRKLGTLSKLTAQGIIETLDSARTLTPEQIDSIKESLRSQIVTAL